MATFHTNSSGQITSATITVPEDIFGPGNIGTPLTIVIQNNYAPGATTMLSNGDFATFVHDQEGYVQQPEIQAQLGGMVDEIAAQMVPTNGGSVFAPANTIVMDVGPDVSTPGQSAGYTTPQYSDPSTNELTGLTIDINTTKASVNWLTEANPQFPNLPILDGSGNPVLAPVYANNTAFKELGNAAALGNPFLNISVPGSQTYGPDTPDFINGRGVTNQVWGNSAAANGSLPGSPAVQHAIESQGNADQNFGRAMEGDPARPDAMGLGFYHPTPNPPHAMNDPTGIPDDSPTPQPGYMDLLAADFGLGQATGSPLVLDLSSDGSGITLSALNSSSAVYWDFGSGIKNASGWVTGTTGLLCVDPTGTGVITHDDLFGNNGTYANGFLALAAYDSNSDGVINSSDTGFGDLRVWVPQAGTNGVSQPADVFTLAELGITSINLDYTNESYQINGNSIEEQSTFVINGNTQTIADAWFAYDTVNTVYDSYYTPNIAAFYLPDQRGYGALPTLDISESLDSTLLSEVQALASKSYSDIMDPSYGLEAKLNTILFEWAGVQSVDPESSWAYFGSTHVDAQKLAFLEQLMGQLYQGTGDYHDIGPDNVGYYGEAWHDAFSYLSAHLLAQAGFHGLMGNPLYNLSADTLSVGGSAYDVAVQFADQALGGFELPHMATNDIFVMNPGDSPVVAPYDSPTIFIEETPSGGGTNILALGVAPSGVVLSDDYSGNLYVHYTSTDTVEILGDVAYVGGYHAGTIVGEYVQQIAFEDGTLWSLTGGLDLTATSTYTAVFGTAMGGDTLDGSGISGADLWGYTGNETYILGPATTVVAGNGTNTYVVNVDSCPASSGGASITPNASATGDQIVLHGVTESQVFLSDNSSGDLLVSTSNGDLVTVHGGSYAYGTGVTLGNIAGITLDDSTVLDLTGVVPLTPTSSGTLLGISTGTDFVANGYESNFDGFNSHDVFSFTAGSAPAASYGANIYEYASGGTSTIAFHGLTPSEVVMTDDSSGDLIFQFGTDLVTVGGGSNTGSGITVGNVQQATFDDSTVWNLQTGLHLTATGDYQYLYGTAGGGDTLTAAGTSDNLFAYTGTETLVAGALSSLHNGTGNDTDVFSTGFGSATVYANASGGSSNAIEFHSITASDLVLSDDIYGQLTIQDTSTSDQILVSGGSYDSSTGFSVGNIQQIALDGSTDISLTGALNLTATGNYQSLYGTGHGDNMTALGTGDNLYGIAGDNTMTGSSSSSATTNFHGGSGNDLMIGGSGTNNMYMGTGDDEIKVEGSSSSTTVTGFDTAHDTIHLEDVMSGFDALTDALSNWVQKTESGGNTVIAVDPTGTGSFTAGPQVTLNSITGLDDIATLVAHGVVHV